MGAVEVVVATMEMVQVVKVEQMVKVKILGPFDTANNLTPRTI